MPWDNARYGQKRATTQYWNPTVNPFRTLPKDAPARGRDQGRSASSGAYNERGNFGGGAGFRGRGGYGAGRGNMGQNNYNRNFSGGMGYNPMGGGGFGGPNPQGSFAFSGRGHVLGGGMRGGGMRGRGGNMMGMNPMGGMNMGMPGNMGMGMMGPNSMPGKIPLGAVAPPLILDFITRKWLGPSCRLGFHNSGCHEGRSRGPLAPRSPVSFLPVYCLVLLWGANQDNQASKACPVTLADPSPSARTKGAAVEAATGATTRMGRSGQGRSKPPKGTMRRKGRNWWGGQKGECVLRESHWSFTAYLCLLSLCVPECLRLWHLESPQLFFSYSFFSSSRDRLVTFHLYHVIRLRMGK